jgi:hypothetical protein
MKTASEMKSEAYEAWPIPSILKALTEASGAWLLFSPECEPFWSEVSSLNHFRKVPSAKRGVVLAVEAAKPAIVFVPNRQLAEVFNFAKNILTDFPLLLIVEDHPTLAPQLMPREIAKQAGLSVIEPCDSTEVAFCASAAVSFSLSLHTPVVLLMHHRLLASSSAEHDSVVPVTQTHRPHADSSSPVHIGRRMELNRQRTLPSPGEQVEVGFVTIGGSDLSLKYLVSELQLLGRVPMLNLRLVNPIDHVPVERLLSRCRHVVVLEPRPGEIEQEIVRIAQTMRRDGRDVASIWGKELPPYDPEQLPVKVPVNSIHPSVVARLTQHLLHDACPSANISDYLSPEFATLDFEPTKRIPFGTNGALILLREMATRVLSNSESHYDVVVDGLAIGAHEGKKIFVETWGESRFLSDGIHVIRDAVSRDETRIFLVWRNYEIGSALRTLVESVLPSKNDDGKRVVEVTIDQGEDVDNAIEVASNRGGVTVIIVRDGEEPHFDLSRLSATSHQIDQLGFRPQHAIVIPIDQMTPVRLVPIDPWKSQNTSSAMLLETSITTRWLKPEFRKWRISLRPILERVEVTRNKPPVRVVAESSAGLTPPKVLHGSAPSWRVHIAGSRGGQPGVVGEILVQAGMKMGYEIRVQCNNRFVGPGRRAWAQLLFTRKQMANSYRPLIGSIPWGDADLLLGWDREEVCRAIDPKGNLRIGAKDKTYAIVNTDPFEHQTAVENTDGESISFDNQTITTSCKPGGLTLRGFASLARYRFHNERLGDVVQLGMAFQLGYIPVTVDAMNVAVVSAEKNGFARTVEAFDFGRRIANDSDSIWQPIKEESQIDLDRLEKRCVRDLRKHGRRGIAQAEVMKRLLRQCRQSLPGLFETAEGRQSITDLFNGIRRCMLWGGEEVANRFVNLVCQVYVVDSAENGRSMTRNVILPLAESILIREPIYLAKLARSPEVLRRIRKRLNVRHSRGDILKRRFLSRFRLRLWNWSLQVDMRTSDWSSVLVSSLGSFVPKRWRGHRRDRAVRETIVHAVNKAIISPTQYEEWIQIFQELNQLAISGDLHRSSVEDIRRIIQL